MSPQNIIEMKRTITEKLSKVSQDQDRELRVTQGARPETEAKIRSLVEAISQGIRSEYVK